MSVLELHPIDELAQNGRFQLVFGGRDQFACARWSDGQWVFSGGVALDFAPLEYHPMQDVPSQDAPNHG